LSFFARSTNRFHADFGDAQLAEFRDALAGLDGQGVGRGTLARHIASIEPVQGINAVGVDSSANSASVPSQPFRVTDA
jgi:hypothetical protein